MFIALFLLKKHENFGSGAVREGQMIYLHEEIIEFGGAVSTYKWYMSWFMVELVGEKR